jgi:hypothetical protein
MPLDKDVLPAGVISKPRNAKLNEEKVRVIHQLARTGVSHLQIAQWFGVHPNTIGNVLARRSWRYAAIPTGGWLHDELGVVNP